MAERSSWVEIRDRCIGEPDAKQAYDAARLAYELGRTVRQQRQARGWSQTELAKGASMAQSAAARFEAAGTVRSLPVLKRLADALDADLVVQVTPRAGVA